MLPAPTHDSLIAKIARAISPGHGWCTRCGTPWRFIEPHTVHYAEYDGVFTLCEPCWLTLDLSTRLSYYWTKINVSWLQPELWPAVHDAIVRETVESAA